MNKLTQAVSSSRLAAALPGLSGLTGLMLAPMLALMLGLVATSAEAQQVPRKGYIVQLADDPAASYDGSVAGLQATRPAAGQRFSVGAAHVQSYLSYLDQRAQAVASAVPAANIYARFGVVVNGFAAQLSDDEVKTLAGTPGVVSIHPDERRSLDTSTTPRFLGLTDPVAGVWNRFDASGRRVKGEDVIIAHIDGGVWPENPSFSDKINPVTGKPVPSNESGTVVYGPAPAKWKGICQTGQGFTAAQCNNKLIGARYFNAGWKAAVPPASWWSFEYVDSPRDADGHGTHTLSTSGGNENVDGLVSGAAIVPGISGIAPRARVAAYKVCYNGVNGPGVAPSGCYPSDSVAAINQAVADGADVINYSISGSRTSFNDPVETAFRNAAFAGVFVAASAGNSNVFPANVTTVAHNSPWIMTVGNSTHNRFLLSTVAYGDGSSSTGTARLSGDALGRAPLVLSTAVGLAGANASAVNLCFSARWNAGVAVLDPAKVAGKIVVCDRGTNDRVDKSRAVREAGGVGMILLNTANQTLNNDAHSLPTVHLQFTARAAARAYAATAGATAAFGAAFNDPAVVAPVMSDSSSRGPNQADANVLKPDITAPGTSILAAFAHQGLTQAQRDAIAAGDLSAATPWYEIISGTSMSSPHIAGMAALLRQANPAWSPYAIKSALMTSARPVVRLAAGAADPSPFGFGAGHANPNGALSTRIVYDTTNAEHLAYARGTLPGGGSQLNLASLTSGTAVGPVTFRRTLSNRGASTETLTASAVLPGFAVTVSPATLTLAPGQSRAFTLTATPTTAPHQSYQFGSLTWTPASGQESLRSPLVVRSAVYAGPTSALDARAIGTQVWSIATWFSGAVRALPFGLTPAQRLPVTVNTAGPLEQCTRVTVPAGAKAFRAQLFNAETQGAADTDIDLYVYTVVNGVRGTLVGASFSGSTDELVTLPAPAAGTLEVCAEAFAPDGLARSTVINSWVVGPAPATNLRAFATPSAITGGTASVGVSWNVPPGARYLGAVDIQQVSSGAVLGTTSVFIDTTPGAGVPRSAAVVQLPEGVEGKRTR